MSNKKIAAWRTSSFLGWPYKLLHFIYFNILRCVTLGLFFLALVYARYLPELKEVAPLATYQSAKITKIYSQDGREISRLSRQNRLYIAYNDMPEDLISAFISAEDKRFFEHQGVDPVSTVRAVFQNLQSESGRRVGASTITQQLAKVIHFGVNSDRTLDIKIKEALLALQMERELSKEQIIELYLNEIPFGLGTFGVASASLRYFGKNLDELNLSEMAYLASLPKGPTNYHLERHNAKATARRDWVIGRMLANGFIEKAEAWSAMRNPLPANIHKGFQGQAGDYFNDQVRRELVQHLGENMVFEGGLFVQTTMDPELQEMARASLRSGLEDYDRRHGWRGSLGRIDLDSATWLAELKEYPIPDGIGDWELAVVTSSQRNALRIRLQNGEEGLIPRQRLSWARPWRKGQNLGREVRAAWDVARRGEVILVDTSKDLQGRTYYDLKQIPDVNGALIALDPRNGHILALQGGYDFKLSQFNRAVQARRQPGSTFKPFVYLAALNEGYGPTSTIKDEPITITFNDGEVWSPKNAGGGYWRNVSLDRALQHSRNLPTVWLAREIGMAKIQDYAAHFGIDPALPNRLANALGAGETTVLRIAGAYATLANKGIPVIPTSIRSIQNHNHRTILDSKTGLCSECLPSSPILVKAAQNLTKTKPLYAKHHVETLTEILRGVFTDGTGRRFAAKLPKRIAGKTGTTNNNRDAWFVGYTDELVVAAFVGFDTPKTLGEKEHGADVAGPILSAFFQKATSEIASRSADFVVVDTKPFQPKSETHAQVTKDNLTKRNRQTNQESTISRHESTTQRQQPTFQIRPVNISPITGTSTNAGIY